MLVVHHLNNSRSQRVLWALEELGVPYEVKRYQRDEITNLAPASLKAIHPLGKSPVIIDGDLTLAESGAIIEYLVRTHGNGAFIPPTSSEAYQSYVYWLHFAEGSLMPPMVLKLVFDKIVSSPMPFFAKPIAKGIAKKVMTGYVGPSIKDNLDFIDSHLTSHEWFAGDHISGADFQMSFPLEAWVARNPDDSNYPKIVAYVKRLHERPAYQKALDAGGPYDYA